MGTPHYMAPEQWEQPRRGRPPGRHLLAGRGVLRDADRRAAAGPVRPAVAEGADRRAARRGGAAGAGEGAGPPLPARQRGEDGTRRDRSGAGGWVRTPTFREYRSKQTFLGLPLVHIVGGLDPQTGRPKTAKGWLAIGDARAVGGIAMGGGSAFGGLAVSGGMSLGVLSVAGGFAFGGFALAGGMAFAAAVAVAGGIGHCHGSGSGRRVCPAERLRWARRAARRAHPVSNPGRCRLR